VLSLQIPDIKNGIEDPIYDQFTAFIKLMWREWELGFDVIDNSEKLTPLVIHAVVVTE